MTQGLIGDILADEVNPTFGELHHMKRLLEEGPGHTLVREDERVMRIAMAYLLHVEVGKLKGVFDV